jgi:hypothetical protein
MTERGWNRGEAENGWRKLRLRLCVCVCVRVCAGLDGVKSLVLLEILGQGKTGGRQSSQIHITGRQASPLGGLVLKSPTSQYHKWWCQRGREEERPGNGRVGWLVWPAMSAPMRRAPFQSSKLEAPIPVEAHLDMMKSDMVLHPCHAESPSFRPLPGPTGVLGHI